MIFHLTAKGCQISETSYGNIRRHLEKIERVLPNIENDLIVLRLVVRKNTDRYYPMRTHPHKHKTYSDGKSALAYFEGSISCLLHKKKLYVHFKGQTVDECVDLGFERFFKEVEKFKDLHFASESEYPDHMSIRNKGGGKQ